VGYAEVLRALVAETRREEQAIADEGAREHERIVDEARRAAAAAREARLAEVRTGLEARRRRVLEAARRQQAQAILVEKRRLLEQLKQSALERLAALHDSTLEKQLLDEVLAEAKGEVRSHPGGGVTVLAGRLILDNTLASRLAKVWPHAEARLAAALFGDGDGAP